LAEIHEKPGSNDNSYRYAYIYGELFASFINTVGRGSTAVYKVVMEYTRHAEKEFRVITPFAIATGWRDHPSSMTLLHKLANEDEHQTVRYAAIYALSEHYHNDPQTCHYCVCMLQMNNTLLRELPLFLVWQSNTITVQGYLNYLLKVG
jgi:hypothetical protein